MTSTRLANRQAPEDARTHASHGQHNNNSDEEKAYSRRTRALRGHSNRIRHHEGLPKIATLQDR
jgi:hypothetical protein